MILIIKNLAWYKKKITRLKSKYNIQYTSIFQETNYFYYNHKILETILNCGMYAFLEKMKCNSRKVIDIPILCEYQIWYFLR